jgi:hypothetical protein
MSEIRVECYAGHRADERPLRFVLHGREFLVHELEGRWYSPQATYFRVRADDGNYYVLGHDEAQDSWTLDGFRAGRGEPMNSAPIDATSKPGLRQHQRVRVPAGLEIQVAGIGNGLLVKGVARVIGLGGMFVRSRKQPPPGSRLKFEIKCPGLSFEAVGKVRDVTDTGMGVEFTVLTQENEKKLKQLLDQLQG